jgi:hypothetical protein
MQENKFLIAVSVYLKHVPPGPQSYDDGEEEEGCGDYLKYSSLCVQLLVVNYATEHEKTAALAEELFLLRPGNTRIFWTNFESKTHESASHSFMNY